VKLPIHAATEDHRSGIWIWEGESLSAVREIVESMVGLYSKNEYFEMHVDGLTPHWESRTRGESALPLRQAGLDRHLLGRFTSSLFPSRRARADQEISGRTSD